MIGFVAYYRRMFSYNILLDIVTAFACLVFAVGLLRFWNRNITHVIFSLLTFCLAIGYLFRSAYLFDEDSAYPKIAYFAFAVFPILLIIFVEKAAGKLANSKFKLFQIFSVLFIAIPLFNRGVRIFVPWWTMYFMFYHIVCIFYTSYLLFKAVRVANNSQEKNIFITILVGTLASSVFIALDWMSRFGYDLPRISAVPLLLMLYFITTIFYGQVRFSFAFELLKLAVTVVFSFVVSLIFVAYVGMDNWHLVEELTWVLSIFLICAQFISKQYRFNYDRSLPERLRQLNSLPKNNLPEYLQALLKLGILQNFRLLDSKDLITRDCSRYMLYFAKHPHAISKLEVSRKLRDASIEIELKNQMQELDFIMEFTGADYLCPVNETGMLLAASSVKLMDTYGFEPLLEIVSDQIGLIRARGSV